MSLSEVEAINQKFSPFLGGFRALSTLFLNSLARDGLELCPREHLPYQRAALVKEIALLTDNFLFAKLDIPVTELMSAATLDQYPQFYTLVNERTNKQIILFHKIQQFIAADFPTEKNLSQIPTRQEIEEYCRLLLALDAARTFDEATPLLAADSTQEENLTYLRDIANAAEQLARIEHSDDFPIKTQMFAALVETGLADPNTRCFPMKDIISITAYVCHLLSQDRVVWISTTSLEDRSYIALKKRDDLEPYIPVDDPQVANLFQFQAQISGEHQLPQAPESTSSPPLFKGIDSAAKFFHEVLPELIAITSREPQAFAKIFPQDGNFHVANVSFDLTSRVVHLEKKQAISLPKTRIVKRKARIIYEASPSYTDREGSGQRVDFHLEPFPHVLADESSLMTFCKILEKAKSSSFLSRLATLLEKLQMQNIILQVMISPKGEILFCSDAIPLDTARATNITADNMHQLLKQKLLEELPCAHWFPPENLASVATWIAQMEHELNIIIAAEQGVVIHPNKKLTLAPDLSTALTTASKQARRDGGLPILANPDRPGYCKKRPRQGPGTPTVIKAREIMWRGNNSLLTQAPTVAQVVEEKGEKE